MTMGIHLRHHLKVLEHYLANLWRCFIGAAPFGGFMSTLGGLICTFEEDVDHFTYVKGAFGGQRGLLMFMPLL
jgi:hypothetical protein